MGEQQKRPAVERVFPKPVRSAFRTMNFHFTEHGRIINHVAKKLPPEEKAEVVEAGKKFCVARSKKNLPRGARNVLTSTIVGQGMWYIGCPLLSHIPGIRESGWGWFAWGGSDKLFLFHDDLLYTTGGFSSDFAGHLAARTPATIAIGLGLFAVEIISDTARGFIEYWTQKKYGIIPDGLERLYGQSRPFMVRFSTFEIAQKIISYMIKPWMIGTPQQIYASVQGFMGDYWRGGPQVLLLLTVGKKLDQFFKKIAEWTGLSKIGKRIKESGEAAERAAMETIKSVLGQDRFLALRYMLAAESRKTWKWNPFKYAISMEKAEKAVKITKEFDDVKRTLAEAKIATDSNYRKAKDEFLERLYGCMDGLTDVFGKKELARIPDYADLAEAMRARELLEDAEIPLLERASDKFSKTLEFLQAERQLA